jgi:hypothetical protein
VVVDDVVVEDELLFVEPQAAKLHPSATTATNPKRAFMGPPQQMHLGPQAGDKHRRLRLACISITATLLASPGVV